MCTGLRSCFAALCWTIVIVGTFHLCVTKRERNALWLLLIKSHFFVFLLYISTLVFFFLLKVGIFGLHKWLDCCYQGCTFTASSLCVLMISVLYVPTTCIIECMRWNRISSPFVVAATPFISSLLLANMPHMHFSSQRWWEEDRHFLDIGLRQSSLVWFCVATAFRHKCLIFFSCGGRIWRWTDVGLSLVDVFLCLWYKRQL